MCNQIIEPWTLIIWLVSIITHEVGLGFDQNMFISGVRNDFAAQLHKFMACLTDTAYKMEGKTVLYIPEEDITSSLEKSAKNKELVARLESKLTFILMKQAIDLYIYDL